MESEEHTKYNIFENVLQKVNQKYVTPPKDIVTRNNDLLKLLDRMIQKLENKDVLFKNLYQRKYYGGSFYDGLKVGTPSEYDFDCVLRFPKIVEPAVEVSDQPGFVHIVLKNLEALNKQEEERKKFPGLEKFLNGRHVCAKKVKSWMEGLMNTVIDQKSKTKITVDGLEYFVKFKLIKSGPALTIKLECAHADENFNIDIDFVPCFTFFDDQWPKTGYRENPSKKHNTFFVVPKNPSEEKTLYWRLSFQEQEGKLIQGHGNLKPAVRLIKKLRDRCQHKIASYFIKTIFLWELENVDEDFWRKSLSFVFVMMLRKYHEYITNRNIPYYWNKNYNLIGDLSEKATIPIGNKIKKIIEDIEKNCIIRNNYAILTHVLSVEERDECLNIFKQDTPVNKEQLKQIETITPQSSQEEESEIRVDDVQSESSSSSSSSSSSTSSFDNIDELDEEPNFKILSQTLSNMNMLLLTLMSEQKCMRGMLETAIDKIDSCENRIKELEVHIHKNKLEVISQSKDFVEPLNSSDKRENIYFSCDRTDEL